MAGTGLDTQRKAARRGAKAPDAGEGKATGQRRGHAPAGARHGATQASDGATHATDGPRRGGREAANDAPPADLTIEQLAGEVGMSVRNIRNHHSRGLLPAPEVRARVGYYSAEHVQRLRLILAFQADGFNLTAIERLLSGSGGSAARLLGLRDAMAAPFESETPEVITAQELQERFGEVDAKDVERIRKLGLLVALGDGRFEVPSPALMKAAEEVAALGISMHTAIDLIERISRDCESISRAFVRLYLKELWEPFEQAGQPEERWDEVIDAIRALRPIASEALSAVFKQRMSAQVENESAKLLARQVKHPR
ncbi:MAG TPA: MerR family transcriptional regulator [Solirubrobacteraceae bacterium]|nr:MerR family transcriptional regulator [Solirubrobacteraceae bacterium]